MKVSQIKILIIFILAIFSLISNTNSYHYFNFPNFETNNVDLSKITNEEITYHQNKLNITQKKTKETICTTMIRNLLVTTSGQELFMSKVNIFSERSEKTKDECFDYVLEESRKKCINDIPPRMIFNNLTNTKILVLGKEEEKFISEVIESVRISIKKVYDEYEDEDEDDEFEDYDFDEDLEDL